MEIYPDHHLHTPCSICGWLTRYKQWPLRSHLQGCPKVKV